MGFWTRPGVGKREGGQLPCKSCFGHYSLDFCSLNRLTAHTMPFYLVDLWPVWASTVIMINEKRPPRATPPSRPACMRSPLIRINRCCPKINYISRAHEHIPSLGPWSPAHPPHPAINCLWQTAGASNQNDRHQDDDGAILSAILICWLWWDGNWIWIWICWLPIHVRQ